MRRSRSIERFADATRGALDLAAEGRLSVAWRHDGTTETAWVLFVVVELFLDGRCAGRRRPRRGRHAGVDGAPSVVIGERFWRRKLNAASLAGLTLRLNNTDVSVAGVLPDSFTGPSGIYSPDVWLPLDELALFNTSPALQKRDDALAVPDGPIEAGHERSRDPGTRRRGRSRDGARLARHRIASAAPGSGCSRKATASAAATDRRRHRGDGDHRPGPAAGLLQRRQPAARPRGRARARHGDSRRARRRARRGSFASSPIEGFVDRGHGRRRRRRARVVDALARRLVRHSDRAAAAHRPVARCNGRRLHRAAGPRRRRASGTLARVRGRACRRPARAGIAGRQHRRRKAVADPAVAGRARRLPGSTAFLAIAALCRAVVWQGLDRRLRLRPRPVLVVAEFEPAAHGTTPIASDATCRRCSRVCERCQASPTSRSAIARRSSSASIG